MKSVRSIQYKLGSKEELLPDVHQSFPYIASYVDFNRFIGFQVPWHWHKEVELFYIEKGALEYYTPKGKTLFPEGWGGLVNSNVLHMTKPLEGSNGTIQREHIFHASIIGGGRGSIFEQKYVTPLTASTQVEIIKLNPNIQGQGELLEWIKLSFDISEEDGVYEMKLRNVLSDIWCKLLDISQPQWIQKGGVDKSCDKVKLMLVYIHEHFGEKLAIADIASAGYVSERECFRIFHKNLHIAPTEYLTDYRLQRACHLLAEGDLPITEIGHVCGLGSSSYFGKVFRDAFGITPSEYRGKWRKNDIGGRE